VLFVISIWIKDIDPLFDKRRKDAYAYEGGEYDVLGLGRYLAVDALHGERVAAFWK
jgi:hypothetical protein